MTNIRVHNPVQTEFAMVPNVLWQWPGLSFKAKGFMAYLLSFRHGVCPPVAAMEAETGLGRDARKAVMRELQAAGLARWVIQRDGGQRVVAKFLEVTTLPLLAAALASVQSAESHTPENPSDGEKSHAPENPSDGKPVAQRRVSRRAATENTSISKRKEKEKEASPISSDDFQRRTGRSAPVLSLFQRSRLLAGQPVLIDGETVLAGSPRMEALRAALRSQDALEQRASSRAT